MNRSESSFPSLARNGGSHPSGNSSVLIMGASTRAAAFSARRSRLEPVCADLFADRDLVACCPVKRLPGDQFPDGFEHVAQSLPPAPWLYVGALENCPELVGRISQKRPLWGNGNEVLRRVRDPFQVAACLGRAGLPCPEVRPVSGTVSKESSWLIKPISSAGGRGIREFANRRDAMGKRSAHAMYLQQRIDGPSCAAVFVGDGQHAALIGLTLQLIGEPSFHAEPFHYCGSIGPLPISTGLRAHLGRLGDVLAGEFALVGLFGVDGIIANDEFWPVEVNPRYTASVEILEAGLCVPAMSLHRDACVNHRLSGNFTTPSDGTVIGKAILFADKAVVVPEWPEVAVLKLGRGASPMALPMMADIPNVGERIGAGRPICTVFAVHSSVQECRNSLVHAARAAYLETQRLHHLTR